jgi:alpha-galactosidase
MTINNSDSGSLVVAQSVDVIPTLDSSVWADCQPLEIRHLWSGEAAPESRHAEARICWNEEGLIVRFVCAQHEPLIVIEKPATSSKTLGLWDRDVCEIFIAPEPAKQNAYFEFEAAPTGEWIDLAIQITPTGRETEWDFSSGMKTTSRIEKEQVLVTIEIPWSNRIPKPRMGDQWRANLFRCVGPDEQTRYLAWRPTGTVEPNFHVPAAFGVLRFS